MSKSDGLGLVVVNKVLFAARRRVREMRQLARAEYQGLHAARAAFRNRRRIAQSLIDASTTKAIDDAITDALKRAQPSARELARTMNIVIADVAAEMLLSARDIGKARLAARALRQGQPLKARRYLALGSDALADSYAAARGEGQRALQRFCKKLDAEIVALERQIESERDERVKRGLEAQRVALLARRRSATR
jgi:hypothetical protein